MWAACGWNRQAPYRRRDREGQVVEEGLHVDAELFVAGVDAGPGLGFGPMWAADAGEDGRNDLFAEGEQRSDGARGQRRNPVGSRPPGLVDELFAAKFAQVVRRLPGEGEHGR